MIPAAITGSGLFTPPESISNAELVATFNAYVQRSNEEHRAEIESGERPRLPESSTEFIEKASGILQRHVMDRSGVLDPARMRPNLPERPNEAPSLQCEMSVAAAREALRNAGREGSEVDAVFAACSNFQRPYPAIAIEVQAALGAGGFAYDLNVACSSATFGIQAAAHSVASGAARCALVVSPEICSGHLDFRDRESHFIFGDACTAIVVEPAEGARARAPFEILGTALATRFSNNIRNNFGFLSRTDEEAIWKRDKLFIQQGRKVFKEVCPLVVEHILAHLEREGVGVQSVRRFWLHQANLSMNLLIGKKLLGRAPSREEAPVILDEYANTSSCGSIIAFHKHHQDLTAGDTGVICSFGAGYSVGSVILRRLGALST